VIRVGHNGANFNGVLHFL